MVVEKHLHTGLDSPKITVDSNVKFGYGYNTGTDDTVVECGFNPKFIRFTAWISGTNQGTSHGAGSVDNNYYIARYNASGTDWILSDGLAGEGTGDYSIFVVANGGASSWGGKISAIGASSFTIDWTKTGSPSACEFIWEAFG